MCLFFFVIVLCDWLNIKNKYGLTLNYFTSGSTAVLATQVTFTFAQEVVLVTLTTTPGEFLTGHALLIVTPACVITETTSSFLWFLAFV